MRGWILLACVLATGCAYHSPDAPTPIPVAVSTAAASIRLVSGTRADRTTDIVATVLTERGAFVVGSRVEFATSAGTLSATSGISDAQGTVHSILTSGENATVRASMDGLTSSIDIPGQPVPVVAPPSPAPPPPPAPPLPTPSANILGPSTSTTGQAVSFNIASQAIGQTWFWSFGDGASAQSVLFSMTHTYASAGVYTVSLSSSATTSGRLVITVSDPLPAPPPPPPPSPALTVTVNCTVPLTMPIFCNLSATDETGTIVTSGITAADWDFGDNSPHDPGNPGAPALSSHTYAQQGNFIVAVSAVGPGGRKGAAQKLVTIH